MIATIVIVFVWLGHAQLYIYAILPIKILLLFECVNYYQEGRYHDIETTDMQEISYSYILFI